MSLRIQCREAVIKLRTTDAGLDGFPNSLTGAGLETTFPAGDLMKVGFVFFQCHKLRQGLGSASGRLSSPLTVRSSQGIEWNCALFHESPLPSVGVRAGLKVERI